MPWTTAVAIYFIFWWLVFFMVLPWGIRSQHEEGDFVRAPTRARLRCTASKPRPGTTLVSLVIFGLFYWAYVTKAVSLDDLTTFWGWLTI